MIQKQLTSLIFTLLLATSVHVLHAEEPVLFSKVDSSCSNTKEVDNHPLISEIHRTLETGSMPENMILQKLSGAQSRDHLERARASRAGLFGMAEADMRKRGYNSTEIVFVIKRLSIDQKSESRSTPDKEETVTSSEGEMTFWSWDDGYDGTYEGIIYTLDYSTGKDAAWSGQMNIETAEYYEVWSNLYSGDPLIQKIQKGFDKHNPAAVQAKSWQSWAVCALSICSHCGFHCSWYGPFWGHCMGGCCGGTIVLCGIVHMVAD